VANIAWRIESTRSRSSLGGHASPIVINSPRSDVGEKVPGKFRAIDGPEPDDIREHRVKAGAPRIRLDVPARGKMSWPEMYLACPPVCSATNRTGIAGMSRRARGRRPLIGRNFSFSTMPGAARVFRREQVQLVGAERPEFQRLIIAPVPPCVPGRADLTVSAQDRSGIAPCPETSSEHQATTVLAGHCSFPVTGPECRSPDWKINSFVVRPDRSPRICLHRGSCR
jgi:hypothetical protein